MTGSLGNYVSAVPAGGADETAVASGRSPVTVALDPPARPECEPGHLVADPE